MAAKRARTPNWEPPDGEVAAQHAYLAVARLLVQTERRVFGLWPVSGDIELQTPSRQLAAALAALSFNVGLVTPRNLWREDVAQSEPLLLLSQTDDGIDVFTPTRTRGADPSAVIERTQALLWERYDKVLFDLSGLDLLGIHRAALVPGLDVVLFVATGRTSEFTLTRIRRELSLDRVSGVVLVDGLRESRLV